MEQEIKNKCENMCEGKCWKKNKGGTSNGLVYCLGFIGAAVYYIQNADTFWAGVLGVLKALAWPAFLVYKLISFLSL